MAKKYSELRAKMSPEARARAEQKTQAMLAEIEQAKMKEAAVPFFDGEVAPFPPKAPMNRQVLAGA